MIYSSPIKEANKIIAHQIVRHFIQEVDSFYMASESGKQLIITSNNAIRGVFDTTQNPSSEVLIETFCNLFTNNTNPLDECVFSKQIYTPTLKLTLQDQSVFYIQDFSRYFLKL